MVDFGPIWLTFQLAAVTTAVLLLIGTPLAWWLAITSRWIKPFVEALTAMPLVLPPTVLGFYFLILFSESSPIGAFWVSITGETLTFSFSGLVIASVIYSLPFMVQPLQTAFENMGKDSIEAAATLGSGPLDTFWHVVIPLSSRGFISGCVLSFAHTVGEFGVVLLIGGSIPNETKVVSIAIYEHVETLRYSDAHVLSALMIGFSFLVLLIVYLNNRRYR
ncbi:MAG: molybdate ABC transporter permease subunit [Pseudomonadales bacterium]|jgi:molybdate transport system permease protein|nr:molybdate ABC transporter permease subunit [Pseudomonadales bacterium]HAO54238.1 molybdate ABC transporter permease subunit [Gammaproteobacteria bacterium]|tara:strand:+ start:4543 stop:5202 length:660 start_codon:yes stop_codon:yes gene_type:complete